jgi:hypothetical protein
MIKVKTVKKKVGGETGDLMDMFNQMTGVKDADPTIIEGKYEDMLDAFSKLAGAWTIFVRSDFGQLLGREMAKACEDIKLFAAGLNEFVEKCRLPEDKNKMKTDFSGNIMDDIYEMGTKYNAKALNETYHMMKHHDYMNHVIITLKNLRRLLEADNKRTGNILGPLDNPNNLNSDFIKKGDDTVILSFSVLDFKFMYNIFAAEEEAFDKLVLFALRVTYLTCSRIYKNFTSPDIDIKKFVEAFKEKLVDMKKVINGCDGAFKCLKASLKLLENNFADYYSSFMVTGNPGIIFENYISDVMKKNENNAGVLVQFKKLVAYIRDKIPKETLKDPQVQKLWTMSEKIFGGGDVEKK